MGAVALGPGCRRRLLRGWALGWETAFLVGCCCGIGIVCPGRAGQWDAAAVTAGVTVVSLGLYVLSKCPQQPRRYKIIY